MNDFENGAPSLPLVIQLGFAGSRSLIDAQANPGIEPTTFEKQIEKWLAQRLAKLRLDLCLEERHFFCGISAVAAGGDSVFTRACRANEICQRVFLPQTRDEFLNARGSKGPDFSDDERAEASRLLDSPHVIQERLVSDSRLRSERFEDVNREIVRVSDVLLCLVREGGAGKAGGTEDLVARAVQRGKPLLEVRVGVADGQPSFTEQWHHPARAMRLPLEPRTLRGVGLPPAKDGKPTLIERYAAAVKDVSSDTAAWMQKKFKWMARIIIGTHIIATLFAAVALGFSKAYPQLIPILLFLELVMLGLGMWVHRRLHHTRTSHSWAEARLLAEVARSVRAIGNLHLYLSHLFSLPFPEAIRPLLRTINVLQLQCTRHDPQDWRPKRCRYIKARLTMKKNGQIDFYERRMGESQRYFRRLHVGFNVCWSVAAFATSLKLVLHHFFEEHAAQSEWWVALLGTLAIVMPVLAAAALSLAAAMDLEAQEHTYRQMLAFLRQQENNLTTAASEGDYRALVLETESMLLGETANWFARRSFTSVA